jgi:hypothetical protein
VWERVARAAVLLLIGIDGNRLEVFGFEDLPAIEALYVVDAISTGEDDCSFMLAGGLHIQKLGLGIIVMIQQVVSRVAVTVL